MTGAPWGDGPSILDKITQWDGESDARVVLVETGTIAKLFGSGGFEGVTSRRRITEPTEKGAQAAVDLGAELTERLETLFENMSDDAIGSLYLGWEAASPKYSVALLDEVLAAVREHPDRQKLAPIARRLVSESRHPTPMKFSIALLGAVGDPSDIPLMSAVGRHPTFGLYATVAIVRVAGSAQACVDPLWELAKVSQGWGKLEVVTRLAKLVRRRPDVQRWLLLEGCAKTPYYEMPALECATSGNLLQALAGPVDEELMAATKFLIDAFLRTGPPARRLAHYRDGIEVVKRYLALLPSPEALSFSEFETVWDLDRWMELEARNLGKPGETESASKALEALLASGWNQEECAAVRTRCATTLDAPIWRERVRDRYYGDDRGARFFAWMAAPRVGLDLWDEGFRQLDEEGLRHRLLQQLLVGASAERRQRVVAWAEERLLDHEDPAVVDELQTIFQEMRDGELFSRPLVLAGLRSTARKQTLRVLAVHPRERWGAEIEREAGAEARAGDEAQTGGEA